MAQAIIHPDSPLDKYLRENHIEENTATTNNHHHTNSTLLQSVLHHLQTYYYSKLMQPPPPSPLGSSSPIPPQSHSSIQDESCLSERLKYLICSSYLLNPNLDPAFYNSQSDPLLPSEIESFPQPTQTTHSLPKPITTTHPFLTHPLLLSWLIPISLLTFMLYYISFISLLLSSLPILLLSFAFLSHHHLHLHLQPIPDTQTNHPNTPRETQLSLQSKLIPQVTQLVNSSQALDLRLSRAIGAVKEIECVALGLGLSDPMPPISRLENASFPPSSLPLPTAANQSAFPARDHHTQHIPLHALGVRKVLQRVLDQLRHDFESTAVELEAAIVNPASNPSSKSPSTSISRATLSALMEMYDCSRKPSSALETQTSLKNSATNRARRQAWRTSLHAQNHENPSLSSPHVSPNHLHFSSSSASGPMSRRLSWQAPPPATTLAREVFHPTHLETGKHSSQQAGSRSRRLTTTTPPLPQSLEHGSRRLSSIPNKDSHHFLSYPPPRSRPLSVHLTAPASPSLLDPQNSLSSMPSSNRKGKPRPVSMYAASPHASSSSAFFGSKESYPNILLEPAHCSKNTNQTEEVLTTAEQVIPYSLNVLLSSFERMNISRKRLMCCLLALDFTSYIPPTSVNMWQDTLEAIGSLLKTVENLSTELTNGMTSEFGPGSFESTPTLRSELSIQSDTFQVADHHHHCQEHQPEEKSVVEVRDFGPPVPESEKKARRFADLADQMLVMDRALQTITAKMKVCMEELEHKEEGGKILGRRAIMIHDSIRVDLECLAREWDESRSKIRTVVEGERVLIPGKNRLRNSLDSNEGSLSMSTSHSSSIYSSEILTPVSEDDSIGLFEGGGGDNDEEEDEDEEFEPIISTIRSHPPMAPPPRLEEILRGVVMNQTSGSHSSQATPGAAGGNWPEESMNNNRPTHSLSSSMTTTTAPITGASNLTTTRKPLRLTAEEYQELQKKRRGSIPLTPRIQSRSRPHSLLSLAPSSSSSSSSPSSASASVAPSPPPPSAGVVTELKDVLISLQSKQLLSHR